MGTWACPGVPFQQEPELWIFCSSEAHFGNVVTVQKESEARDASCSKSPLK